MEGFEIFFKEFDWSKLAIFALFALPGFISLRVWSLIVPTSERPLKDEIGEAISFGVLNAMICAPLFALVAPQKPIAIYGLAIATLVILPSCWPFLLNWAMELLRAGNINTDRVKERVGRCIPEAGAVLRNRPSEGWRPRRRLLRIEFIRRIAPYFRAPILGGTVVSQ